MIQEQYISFEVAKLLKSRNDFHVSSRSHYNTEGGLYFTSMSHYNLTAGDDCIAPTQQLVMRWLREVHKIHIQVFCPIADADCNILGVKYNVVISDLKNCCLAFDTPLEDIEYDTYEEACEAAIKYCLMNLI